MTILENNCVQSIATAAGYMTMPLTSGLAAYMWATNQVLPPWQIPVFNVVLSCMGVLVAFPMKRRFINDEQHPFPEGRACGVVLDTLYHSGAAAKGMLQAKALAVAAAIAGFTSFIAGESYMKLLQQQWLGFSSSWHLPVKLDGWYYWLVEKGYAPLPKLAGVDIRQLALSPGLDFAMIGAGGLMGIRVASSLLLGALLNFVVVAPVMISLGEIQPREGSIAAGTAIFGRAHILNNWALWYGITMMVVASLVALFAKPEIFVAACKTLRRRRNGPAQNDLLRDIELPLVLSWIGVPVFGAIGVWMLHAWFGVNWVLGALAIPLILVLALIAASSTALTGITPSGSLSRFRSSPSAHSMRARRHRNLMTAVMSSEWPATPRTCSRTPGRPYARRQATAAGDRARHRDRCGRALRPRPCFSCCSGSTTSTRLPASRLPTRWSAISSRFPVRCNGRVSPTWWRPSSAALRPAACSRRRSSGR
ncbi:MAG: OPT/YSL family transporter [Proteobacteria bacterium]|nr:OPT/YSL family transporter [Pseudomonadota bacterium]